MPSSAPSPSSSPPSPSPSRSFRMQENAAAKVGGSGTFRRFRLRYTSDEEHSGPWSHPTAKKSRLEGPGKEGGDNQIRQDDPEESSASPCHRCRRLKKKCSRSLPACSSCVAARATCSFSSPESSLSPSVEGSIGLPAILTEVKELKTQVEWLSQGICRLIEQQPIQTHLQKGPRGTVPLTVDTIGNHTGEPAKLGSIYAEGSGSISVSDDNQHRHIWTDLAGSTVSPQPSRIWGGSDHMHYNAVPECMADSLVQAPLGPGNVDEGENGEQGPGRVRFDGHHSHSSPEVAPMAHQIAARVQNRTDKEPMRVGRTVTREHLPTGLDHRKCVKAFFNYIHEAYPVFDRTKVTAEAEQYFMAAAKPGSIPCANVPVKLYMIIVIGCAALCSVRKLPEDMAERVFVPYQEIMNDCLMLPSVETIENLLLLALYSIYDPLGVSPWTLTGVLGRQAIAIGLNRKCRIVGDEGGGASAADDNSNGPAVMATTGLEAEHRHRLFWAIYQFDRMIAAAFGLPFVIDDQSINVPLPGITVEEFASSERIHYTRVLQVSRNSIGLRNLEGRVFQQVHLGNSPTTSSTSTGPSISISTSSLTYIDRRAILEDFRSRIDDWYAQRCLLSRLEKDNVEFLNTIGWLNLRYYSLLALLYCPSDFNSQLSSGQVSDLHRTIEQYIYYCAVLFQQQHFPLTYITLNRLLLVLLILLFCIDSSSHPGDVKGGRIDAHVVISLCIPILEAFPDRWSSAKRMLVLFRRLDCVPQLGQPPDHGSATNSTMFDETLPLASSAMGAGSYQQAEASRKGSVGQGVTFEDGLERIKNDAFALSQEILGPSSVYNNFS